MPAELQLASWALDYIVLVEKIHGLILDSKNTSQYFWCYKFNDINPEMQSQVGDPKVKAVIYSNSESYSFEIKNPLYICSAAKTVAFPSTACQGTLQRVDDMDAAHRSERSQRDRLSKTSLARHLLSSRSCWHNAQNTRCERLRGLLENKNKHDDCTCAEIVCMHK